MNLKEQIAAMNGEQIEQRIAAIKTELDQPNADIDKLNEEYDLLDERRKTLKGAAEKRAALASRIAGGMEGRTIQTLAPLAQTAEPEQRYTTASPEYKNAWLKNLAKRSGVTGETEYIFGKPTEIETRAFMFATTNENVNSLVPVDIQNRIIELVESDSPMLDDAEMSNMTRGFGVPRHKSIDAGDAKGVAEGTANVDEEDTFDLITMDGIEIKKHLVITRKMQFQSISAFEDWVTTHLAARIRVAKERVIMARLDGTAPEAGTINADLGIAAGNKLTGKAYEDADIRSVFAKLKGAGARVVYANNATIWNHLAGMENAKGEKLFTPNSMVDPIVAGRIYGAEVKVDNNLGDNIVYFGVKRGVKANNFDDLTIHSAIEPKTMNTIITAYSLFDAGLENPEAFAKVTFTA